MFSVERCRELLEEDMSDTEVERLRDALYAFVESALDSYLTSIAKIDVCATPSSTAESQAQDSPRKDTG